MYLKLGKILKLKVATVKVNEKQNRVRKERPMIESKKEGVVCALKKIKKKRKQKVACKKRKRKRKRKKGLCILMCTYFEFEKKRRL